MGHMPVRPYVKPALKYRIIFRKPTVNRVSENVKKINDQLVKAAANKEHPATKCHEELKDYCVYTVAYKGGQKETNYCRIPWKKFVACLRKKMKDTIEAVHK